MPDAVTEAEIEKAEELRGRGELTTSLGMSRAMLERTTDCATRMRLLFNVVICSAQLELTDITNQAMAELDTMPDPDFCRACANMDRAYAEDQLGRPANALAILDAIIDAGYFEPENCRTQRYQLFLFKGQALISLRRPADALESLDKAHALYPSPDSTQSEDQRRIFGWVEPSIQINRANCLFSFDRFEEAFQAAAEVLRWTDGDLATFARQYMAECRLAQGRVSEALEIYADLKKRLPCRLVDEARVEKEITNCMDYLEKRGCTTKPS